MVNYQRTLELPQLLRKKSFFLFGPRGTGKTSLIRAQLPKARIYDLLDAEVFGELVRRPKLIEEQLEGSDPLVVVDEIQKLPLLLDEVHRLISKRNVRFLLTGSSARKLKRGAANMLAGRAWEASLFPLTWQEIPKFSLIRYLNTGGLPYIYDSSESSEELRSYVNLYLREEIQAEAITRNITAFSHFLDAVALANGSEVNYESLASDCAVSPGTLKNYFQVLEDTLIGFCIPAFTKTKKRKAITRAKHFLFDIGVVNTLCRRGEIKERSELFGSAFEQFIVQEVRAYLSYLRLPQHTLTYWRSTSQFEVDLIIGNTVAVEIKSTNLISDKHLKGLRALKEEGLIKSYAVVSLDRERRKTEDGIQIYPWESFLRDLWGGRIV